MAITTYSELLTAVAAWLNRSDLTSRIPEFIALAEAQMNRELRVRQMLVRATATITDEYSTVPTDFLGVRWITLDDKPMAFVDQADLAGLDLTEGRPVMYSVVGGDIRYYPPPAESYTAEMAYWARIPALTATNTTNWLLTAHPDAYLYGTLLHSAPYLRDGEAATVWSQGFMAALEKIRADDQVQTFGDRRRLRRPSFN